MELDEPNKLLNTDYSGINVLNYTTTMPKVDNVGGLPSYRVQLTTKKAVELLLEGTLRRKVCRYCLSVASPLSDLDQIMQIAGKGTLYKVTIRDMVACFHPFKTQNDPNFPRKICNKCLNRTISAYLFTQQCEQSERALRNCFDDMYAKLDKLDPLDKTKKRGRQKLNPNYNVLHANHEYVIDYAEPIRNLVNVRSVSLSNETHMSDLECPKCWQIFTKIEDLIAHEKSHPSNMWFNCRLCGRSFVKRLQLKRHLKTHVAVVQPEEKHDFRCGTCGFGSEDHSVHLQHMEKHKFQSVLEHIVEKKMDKLCTVCLDEKPKLVELDKMVRLHGGYPGATGDKTLYSILGSTLPDKKTYKYQELYVAHHAKIMKIAKLTRDKPNNETRDISGLTNQIIISNPLFISNDKFDCDEMYLFFFSDPSYYKNNGKEENINIDKNIISGPIAHYDKNEDLNVSVSRDETKNNREMVFEEQCENNETIIKINDELNLNGVTKQCELKQNITIENTTPVNKTACKICWIFKKPNCKTCIDELNTTGKSFNKKVKEVNGETKDKCMYCWIFKTSDKCGVCKNPINLTVTTNVYKEEENKTIKDTDFQRKRKISYDTKLKNKKWDCEICLTTNIEERLTCICCESNRNNQDTLKVNLDCKHAFKVFKANDVTRNQGRLKQIFKTVEANANDKNLQLIPMVDTVNIIPEVKTVNFEEMNKDTCKTFDSSNLTHRKNIEDLEEMDIEENTIQIITPNPNPFLLMNISYFNNNTATSTNVKTQSSNNFSELNNLEQSSNVLAEFGLKFNIGAGSSKKAVGRRIMKPIRRMAYHK